MSKTKFQDYVSICTHQNPYYSYVLAACRRPEEIIARVWDILYVSDIQRQFYLLEGICLFTF